MAQVEAQAGSGIARIARRIPAPMLWVSRGVGQVFFQENASTGALFLVGIALSSPVMAVGAVVGAAVGTGFAWISRYDQKELAAGIYGFNATLVGIGTLFFFEPGVTSFILLVLGCAAATAVTRLARGYLPFPTYTGPFIVTTWVLYFLGLAMGLPRVEAGAPLVGVGPLGAAANGVSQVMFQANLWTALFFLGGIAINDWEHALLVLAGSVVGVLLGMYVATAASSALDPERLVDRGLLENVALGLFGYNAALAPVALFLARRSLIPPLLGMVLAVLLTELFPLMRLPALTAPFVVATWIVLALFWADKTLFPAPASPSL